MFGRILSAVSVVIVGFAIVVGVVLWQIRHVSRSVSNAREIEIPLYRTAVEINEDTLELEQTVVSAFRVPKQDELAAIRSASQQSSTHLQSKVKQLGGARFASVHSLPVPAAETATATDKTQAAATNVGALLRQLETDTAAIDEMARRVIDLAEQQIVQRQALETEREELSKAVRLALPLATVNEAAFANLNRAALNVLYASSTRDLNFVGRAKFKDGATAMGKAKLDEGQQKLFDGLKAQFEKTLTLALAVSAMKADSTFFTEQLQQVRTAVQRLRKFSETEFSASQDALTAITVRISRSSLWLSVITIAVGLVLATYLARRITRDISAIVREIATSSGSILNSSNHVAASAQSLSEGASTQAASLEETSASMEEISGMSARNSENAGRAKLLATETRAAADSGAAEVVAMNHAMDEIKESSSAIAKIVKAIDEIAFQTNILALNAGVEAARAGAAGAGFAVVAEEVRALAKRSADAARESAEKIADSVEKSQRAADVCSKVSTRLQEIAAKSRAVDDIVTEIATASNEQNAGIRQVNVAVTQMDTLTQATSHSATEGAEVAKSLTNESQALHECIERLAQSVGTDLPAASANGSHSAGAADAAETTAATASAALAA